MAMAVPPKNSGLEEPLRTGSETSASQHLPSAREPGDLERASSAMVSDRQTREGDEPRSAEHALEESDSLVVPEKSGNSWVTPEDSMEERSGTDGKPADWNAYWAQDQENALTHVARVGAKARKDKEEKFTNLLSHIKAPLLDVAYRRLRKRAAVGVDGETWEEFGQNIDGRLRDLQERVHRGSYHPLPVRRVYIEKADGKKRPLGIPALEDKIVQQAVRMLMEPIYEESEFLGFSYGFRPGRAQHQALDALAMAIGKKVNWVLDADIRSFFDTIDHGWMQKFIEHRIADRRLVRLLMKWLHAGVLEEGKLVEVEEGTPQGGVISPLLANIYLHYVLDLWAHQWRRRHARGEVYIVRYADDVVMGFQYESDARAMREALEKRLAKFALELHPEKTRVIRFGRFARRDCALDGRKRPETFDFLGFTHICAEGPKGFRYIRRTSRKKRNAKLAALSDEIGRRRHQRVVEQYAWLTSVLRGHYLYYGVPGNFPALRSFFYQVRRRWHAVLQRRSQRARWTDERRARHDATFALPQPRITHPWPHQRFSP
jgi:group II intron reverse transcriptase/maturase